MALKWFHIVPAAAALLSAARDPAGTVTIVQSRCDTTTPAAAGIPPKGLQHGMFSN